MILHGDSLNKMSELEENSIDAIVTDPPYGLSFMGKKWDYDVPSVELWKEVLRVLKPGAFLLSFSGTRTYHRMAVNIEDAGFEIRDMISWLYGSGFPKSLNIGKQIDKIQGNEREIIGKSNNHISNNNSNVTGNNTYHSYGNDNNLTKGNSEWEGWGTALKPACEPIVVARKPLSEKNVALNVLKWGTGGVNIDGCRVGMSEEDRVKAKNNWKPEHGHDTTNTIYKTGIKELDTHQHPQGRFPANIILDEEAGEILDKQSGNCGGKWGSQGEKNNSVIPFSDSQKGLEYLKQSEKYKGDKGGASRFFYCAKASKKERNMGCEELEENHREERGNNQATRICVDCGLTDNGINNHSKCSGEFNYKQCSPIKNNHPTVKPIKLMEYLVKLVSKENAIVLDPFMGSGTTGIACVNLNREFIGIEREEDYIKIARARIKATTQSVQKTQEDLE